MENPVFSYFAVLFLHISVIYGHYLWQWWNVSEPERPIVSVGFHEFLVLPRLTYIFCCFCYGLVLRILNK